MTPVGLANSKVGSTIRVMGSLGSTFSADPCDPGVGKGRQGSRFRYDLMNLYFFTCFIGRLEKVTPADLGVTGVGTKC